MYGLASTMFGNNIDFATRGSLAARNNLVIPTQFADLPVVGTLAKAVGNLVATAQAVSDPNVATGRAILHGIAHNGMNRPIQGLAQIAMGDIDSTQGNINWADSNHIDYKVASELSWSAMFARAIGTKPLNETIVQNAYFRQAEYKANIKRDQAALGAKIQFSLAEGTVSGSSLSDFAQDYEESGGEIQSFNAYMTRQLKGAGNGTMQKFQEEMGKSGNARLGRSVARMGMKQSSVSPWATDY